MFNQRSLNWNNLNEGEFYGCLGTGKGYIFVSRNFWWDILRYVRQWGHLLTCEVLEIQEFNFSCVSYFWVEGGSGDPVLKQQQYTHL